MSAMEDDPDYTIQHDTETQDELVTVISDVLSRRRNAMVTKFVVIAELIGDDGLRAIWTSASPGITSWDEKALIGFAQDKILVHELLVRLASLDKDE